MNCATCSKLIYDYLDREVDEQTRQEMEIHLSGCEACRLELMEIKEGLSIYKNWGLAVQPSAEFKDKVMIQLTNLQPVSVYPFLRAIGFGLISALALLAFFVTPVLYSLATVMFDLFVNILPLPGIYISAFPVVQNASLAVLGVMLLGMTWAMRRAIEH
ncbi:hypothetical protein SCACP_40760 [Sporomusa carbonis]|uniref:anti-sigma factor family protein n=1 Tax=Sporomusa carbonis TaxID=3076075 RepID=UPI003A6B113C